MSGSEGPVGPQKVLVVGAGIVGTVCACSLLREGHEVTLVDRGGPGEMTSFGNSGAISPASLVPIAMPGMVRQIPKWLLDPVGPLFLKWSHLPRSLPWLCRFLLAGRESRVRRISKALATLNMETFEAYGPLLKEAGLEHLFKRGGQLFVYHTEAGFQKAALGMELRRTSGLAVEDLNGDEIRQLEPTLAPVFERGVLIPGNGHCTNPFGLVQGLAEHFQRAGGKLLRREVLGFEMGPEGPRQARTAEGNLPFDKLVIAAGVWSTRLTRQLGTKVPLESHRGYHVTIPDPQVIPRMIVFPVDYHLAITPLDIGLRFSGTVELAGLEAPPNYARARVLNDIGRRLLPGVNTDHFTEWMGHRPCTPDSLPVLGPSPRHRNVYFAFGHGHQGLLGASKTGQVIAEIVSGRPSPIDLAPFRSDRF